MVFGPGKPVKDREALRYANFVSVNIVDKMIQKEEEGPAGEVNGVLLVPSTPHPYSDEYKPRLSYT